MHDRPITGRDIGTTHRPCPIGEVCTPPWRGTLPERVVNALHLRRIGPGLWRGECQLCRDPAAFTLELNDHGLAGRCAACADPTVGLFLWLVQLNEARDRRRQAEAVR